jgi:hypothetical protein
MNATKNYVPASSVVAGEYTPTAVAAGIEEITRRIHAESRRHSRRRPAVRSECHFGLARITDRFLELRAR